MQDFANALEAIYTLHFVKETDMRLLLENGIFEMYWTHADKFFRLFL